MSHKPWKRWSNNEVTLTHAVGTVQSIHNNPNPHCIIIAFIVFLRTRFRCSVGCSKRVLPCIQSYGIDADIRETPENHLRILIVSNYRTKIYS